MKSSDIGFLAVVAGILAGCAELKEDLPAPVASGVQAHGLEWVDTLSPGFHGTVAQANNDEFQSCLTCHGWNFDGGTSGVSCVTCHRAENASLHGKGWTDPASLNFHGKAIRAANWDMRDCQTCHGPTYAGGRVSSSCRDCHTGDAGPENCTTCHGNTNPAPPRDLSGNTSTTARGVGAHQKHFIGPRTISASPIRCSDCHSVPSSVYDQGHVDTPSPAEVMITARLARIPSAGMTPSPAYDQQMAKCSDSFCHGNWSLLKSSSQFPGLYTDSVMTGMNYAPLWTGGSSEIACGTCHGLPPAGHLAFQPSECGACHDMIVNSAGNIVDREKHINGKINVFGSERDFR